MGLVLDATFAACLWVVLWALGAKSFDALLLALVIVLVVRRHAPPRRRAARRTPRGLTNAWLGTAQRRRIARAMQWNHRVKH